MRLSGAGVMLLQHCAVGNRSGLALLLFANVRRGNVSWEELGGSIDPGETAAVAAAREATEESCNLIRPKSSSLQQCPSVTRGTYKCFQVQLASGIRLDHYHSNRALIAARLDADKHFLETHDCTRVFLDDMLPEVNLWRRGPLGAVDVFGRTIAIHRRTAGVLQRAILQRVRARVLNVRLQAPWRGRRAFLNGTAAYELS